MNVQDEEGRATLYYGGASNEDVIAQVLLSNGAMDLKNKRNICALDIARIKKNERMAQKLEEFFQNNKIKNCFSGDFQS